MGGESQAGKISEIHVEMWRHYDDLRQKKNSTFLTASSILAVIVGFRVDDDALVRAVSLLGILIGVAWFLILTRNDAYIAFHRARVGEEWRPRSWTPPSTVLDRLLPASLVVFWTLLLGETLVVWRVSGRSTGSGGGQRRDKSFSPRSMYPRFSIAGKLG